MNGYCFKITKKKSLPQCIIISHPKSDIIIFLFSFLLLFLSCLLFILVVVSLLTYAILCLVGCICKYPELAKGYLKQSKINITKQVTRTGQHYTRTKEEEKRTWKERMSSNRIRQNILWHRRQNTGANIRFHFGGIFWRTQRNFTEISYQVSFGCHNNSKPGRM